MAELMCEEVESTVVDLLSSREELKSGDPLFLLHNFQGIRAGTLFQLFIRDHASIFLISSQGKTLQFADVKELEALIIHGVVRKDRIREIEMPANIWRLKNGDTLYFRDDMTITDRSGGMKNYPKGSSFQIFYTNIGTIQTSVGMIYKNFASFLEAIAHGFISVNPLS